MFILVRLLARAVSLRRTVRFRWWVLKTRVRLAAHNCSLEVVGRPNVAFHTPPTVELTHQPPDRGQGAGGRGRLRIEIGHNVHLGRDLTIELLPWTDNVLVLGAAVACGTAVRLVLFGGEIRIGAWSRLRDGVMLKTSGRLSIGESVIVQNQCLIHCAESVVFEDRVGLAERVTVIDSDHLADGSDTWLQDHPIAIEPVLLEHNVFIAANGVVMRGAHIGRNAVVAAGSVVRSGTYPAGWLIAGTPAQAKKPLRAVEPVEA